MKVLHLTPAYEPAWSAGGVVRGTSLLCRALSALGHEVTVYATDTSGDGRLDVPVNQPVDIGGVRVFYFYTEMPRAIRYSRTLTAACRETLGGFDLMHMAATWNYPGIVAGFEARRQGVPYVLSTDGSMQAGALKQKRFKKWVYLKLFEKRNLRGAAAIRYVSELEREQTAHLGLSVPSFMIPSGLDFSEFEHLPTQQAARAELGIPEDALVVGYLGRLDRRKALDVLIRAFARIVPRFPSALLLLAGPDYGEEDNLHKLAQELDLNQHVRFPGYVAPEERTTMLAATDIMTLTGLEGECFGNAAVEAAAVGVPVLMSNNVGVGSTLEEDDAGVIVPVDEGAIPAALERLLSDPALLKEMGQKGYRSAREHFDMRIIAEKMAIAYEDVLTGRRSPECRWA